VKPNQLARLAAVVLLLAGVAALLAAGLVAVRSFDARGLPQNPRRFDCGSVLFAKDPLTLVPRQANQPPPNFRQASANCEKLRSSRTRKSLTFMFAGVAPVLLVLALPAISRRSRRAKTRRRLR
jgi:hypothetical protein